MFSCTASKTINTATVILDGSASKIKGGNGHGYFTTWRWRQIKGPVTAIENPNAKITKTIITSGSYEWELIGVDNMNNVGKDTLKIGFKSNF